MSGSRGGSSTAASTVVSDTVGFGGDLEDRAVTEIIVVDQQPSGRTVPCFCAEVSKSDRQFEIQYDLPVQFSLAAPREPYSIVAALVTLSSAELGIKMDWPKRATFVLRLWLARYIKSFLAAFWSRSGGR